MLQDAFKTEYTNEVRRREEATVKNPDPDINTKVRGNMWFF